MIKHWKQSSAYSRRSNSGLTVVKRWSNLEAELDVLAQDGQHARVVVGDAPLEQVVELRVRAR